MVIIMSKVHLKSLLSDCFWHLTRFWLALQSLWTWAECQQSHPCTGLKDKNENIHNCLRMHSSPSACVGQKLASPMHHGLLQSIMVTPDLKWACPLALTFDFWPPNCSERRQRLGVVGFNKMAAGAMMAYRVCTERKTLLLYYYHCFKFGIYK